jgi:uncharacterized protein
MQQFLIIARDGTDPEATVRRMNARPDHFKLARVLKNSNNFIIGGAMLDDKGDMIGSMMVVQFENEDELKMWLKQEPYVNGDVWKEIEVKPFRVAIV